MSGNETGGAEASEPLPMHAVGTNGFKLRGPSWGNDLGKKPLPPPEFGILGKGVDSTNVDVSTLRPKSPAAPRRFGQPAAPNPSPDRQRASLAASTIGARSSSPVSGVSNVVLTLDASPLASRRVAAPLSPSRQLSATTLTTPSNTSSLKPTTAAAATAAALPPTSSAAAAAAPAMAPLADELPEGVPRGGADEIAWLRAQLTARDSAHAQLNTQLQRMQQEVHAMRSSLIAQQQQQQLQRRGSWASTGSPPPSGSGSFKKNRGSGDRSSGEMSPGPVRPPPLARRGSISNLAGPHVLSARNDLQLAKLHEARLERKHKDHVFDRCSQDSEGSADGSVMHVHPKDDSRAPPLTLSRSACRHDCQCKSRLSMRSHTQRETERERERGTA